MLLIVDDEPLVAEEMAEALDLAGIPAQWSTDPLEALARAAALDIRLVVTDLRMPGLDGAVLIDRLRAFCPGIRFVIVSGHGAAGNDAADPPDVLGRFRKPVDVAALIALLRPHIET